MKKVIIATLLGLSSASAFAASPYWTNNRVDEVYVGGNVGHSNLRHFNGADIGTGVRADNSDTSFGVYTGYQFHRNFSAELGYNKLGNYSTSVGDIDAQSWNLSLVGKYPLNNQLAVTGRVGAAFTDANLRGNTSHNTTPVYGLGLEYAVNKQVALTTNWDRYNDFADTGRKLDNVSVGVKYRF